MSCGTAVSWKDVPAGSKLTAKTRGTNSNYTARIRIVVNHDPSIFWEKPQLDPGPAAPPVPINAGDQIAVFPRIVAVGADAATVTMDMWIEKDGVKIRECTWDVTPQMSPFIPIIIIIQGGGA